MKKFYLLFVFFQITTLGRATDFVVDGIKYTITSTAEKTVEVKRWVAWDINPTIYNDVVIPQSVTYEGRTYAVTSIGEGAFKDCSNSLFVDDSLNDFSHFYLYGIKSVVIFNSVTNIKKEAFANCFTMETISLGNNVINIGEGAFRGCSEEVYCGIDAIDFLGVKSIVIPNSVTSIGKESFAYCFTLESVTIGSSVTTIGDSAFKGCSKILWESNYYVDTYGLKNITIPNSVEVIGNEAFAGCFTLESVIIGNFVTIIGDGAFKGCGYCEGSRVFGFKSIVIPDNVTSIGNEAFADCFFLENLTIGNSVISIGDGAFKGCGYCDGSRVFGFKSIVIPDNVTSIGNGVFQDCCNLRDITIGDGLTTISEDAFSGSHYDYHSAASNPLNLTIGKSITTIADNAFKGFNVMKSVTFHCKEIKSWFSNIPIEQITIGDEVTSIGDKAFKGCSQEDYDDYHEIGPTSIVIPNSVTSIGKESFAYCFTLESATIGSSVTTIGESAFKGCSKILWGNDTYGLKKITIPNSVEVIGNEAFAGCFTLESVTIGNSVTTIGDGAFKGCGYCDGSRVFGFKSIVIPDNVTSIGNGVFQDCRNLRDITIGDGLTTISENAFSGSHYDYDYDSWFRIPIPLNLIIGKSITTIADNAFKGFNVMKSVTFHCREIKSWFSNIPIEQITIGDEVTSIGDKAFKGCSREFVDDDYASYIGGPLSIVIPYSVVTIGNEAFADCFTLENVTIGNSVTSIGERAFTGCGFNSIIIPDNVTNIGNSIFYECSNLGNVTLGNALNNIGDYSFYKCSSLMNIDIPNSVTTLGKGVFFGCLSLKSITLGNELKCIGDNSFSECTSLMGIDIPNSVTTIGNSVFQRCSNLERVTLGNALMSIGDNSFNECSSLMGIDIPNSVKTIGNSVFQNCSNLERVTLGNALTNIGDNSFYGCSSLTSIDIPNSVTTLGKSAFYGCSHLKSVTLGIALKSIGNSVFTGCTSLESISVLCSPTTIGSGIFPNSIQEVTFDCERVTPLFKGLSSITDLTMKEGVTSIASSAFQDCTGLTNIVIPNSVTTIEESAFNGCANITTIEMGESVSNIGMRAFANIDKLNDVTCFAEEVPTTDRTAFENSYTDYAILHVPNIALNDYKSTAPWSGFKEVVPLIGGYYTLTYLVDDKIYRQYEMACGVSIIPEPEPTQDGYIFSGWSEIPEVMPDHDVTVTGYFTKSYDVADLTILINCIMGRSGSTYNALYDLNCDGELNIGDVILVVKYIHKSQYGRPALVRTDTREQEWADQSRFTAAQFVLTTEDGAGVASIRLIGGNAASHRLSYESMGEGRYSVVVYSTTNELFAVDGGALIEVTFTDSNDRQLLTSDVVLATPDGDRLWLDSLPAGTATAITNPATTVSYDIVNLKGQKLGTSKGQMESLPEGIYIINGKKTVVR